MPSKEQRIHGWVLMGMLAAAMAGAICGLLWVFLTLSGDTVGAAAARVAALTSASVLMAAVVGQTVWLSYSQIRTR